MTNSILKYMLLDRGIVTGALLGCACITMNMIQKRTIAFFVISQMNENEN